MKKILFIMMFVFAVQISNAQVYDIYIPDGVVLSNNQWHIDGYSVVQANANRYLVIHRNGYKYCNLSPFDEAYFSARVQDVILAYKPYFYCDILGWFVEGQKAYYFAYPYDGYCILSTRPVYYDYFFEFCGLRHLNLRTYYWYRPYLSHPKPYSHHRPMHRPAPHQQRPHHPGGYDRPPQNGKHNPPHQPSHHQMGPAKGAPSHQGSHPSRGVNPPPRPENRPSGNPPSGHRGTPPNSRRR